MKKPLKNSGSLNRKHARPPNNDKKKTKNTIDEPKWHGFKKAGDLLRFIYWVLRLYRLIFGNSWW
ncbi:hypothetical protein PL78_03405 [Yersinia entomophaga]|uniref:Uncharacterized protein n=1 Tax=Yersinia entomophaga TaxID=935293 RepID=A0ABN4PNZ9_YERET|nr:hypothetical protein [Yersinia entomophaga]ANI28888.1 hypothetical protein PL78_03405 [Yersinia entomophaga]OWF85529.1 hypothetical protein B4914_17210 [Yersinia entomophaga]